MHPRNSTLESLKRFAGAVIQCSQDFATENQSNNAVLIFFCIVQSLLRSAMIFFRLVSPQLALFGTHSPVHKHKSCLGLGVAKPW